ncbi:MAG: hypothetical protein JWQ66_559 [Mucilaginibacter sp.]|nr:hypothetical protein [Mucilaginibacter sp.]
MKILVCLNVKFGFALDSLIGLVRQKDREAWEDFQRNYSCDICACPDLGRIYFVIRECYDLEKFAFRLAELPLIKEGFLEFEVHKFGWITSMNILFSYSKFKDSLVVDKP